MKGAEYLELILLFCCRWRFWGIYFPFEDQTKIQDLILLLNEQKLHLLIIILAQMPVTQTLSICPCSSVLELLRTTVGVDLNHEIAMCAPVLFMQHSFLRVRDWICLIFALCVPLCVYT